MGEGLGSPRTTQAPLLALSAVVAGSVLVVGLYGTMAGALVGLAEAVRMPAIVLGVALFCLRRGAEGLSAIAGWSVIGLAAALGVRCVLGVTGWLPSTEGDPTAPDMLFDAAWLCGLSVLALRGQYACVSGPMLAAIIVTTRIGAFVEVPAALMWEAAAPSVARATFGIFAVQVTAGVLAAGLVVIGSGWLLARFAGAVSRIVAPAVLLGMVGLGATLARAWHMLSPGL